MILKLPYSFHVSLSLSQLKIWSVKILTLKSTNICNHTWRTMHSIQPHVAHDALYTSTRGARCTLSNHTWRTMHSIEPHVVHDALYPITCGARCTLSNHTWHTMHSIQPHVAHDALYPCLCPIQIPWETTLSYPTLWPFHPMDMPDQTFVKLSTKWTKQWTLHFKWGKIDNQWTSRPMYWTNWGNIRNISSDQRENCSSQSSH